MSGFRGCQGRTLTPSWKTYIGRIYVCKNNAGLSWSYHNSNLNVLAVYIYIVPDGTNLYVRWSFSINMQSLTGLILLFSEILFVPAGQNIYKNVESTNLPKSRWSVGVRPWHPCKILNKNFVTYCIFMRLKSKTHDCCRGFYIILL